MGFKETFTLWLTGLPCSGKTTLSNAVKTRLDLAGFCAEQFDGDVLRLNYPGFLGYSKEDRTKNIRHIVSEVLWRQKNGISAVVSVISPYRSMREHARERLGNVIEVYVRCPLAVCEKRDVKGMYKLARLGQIKNFTGISDPYEEPLEPELIVDTDTTDIASSAKKITDYLSSLSSSPEASTLSSLR